MSADCESILRFAEDFGLKLNVAKTQATCVIMFGNKSQLQVVDSLNLNYLQISNVNIKFSDRLEYHGIIFQSDLGWDTQISSVLKK